jgi:aldehyde:ferredoxin oxidoreductase
MTDSIEEVIRLVTGWDMDMDEVMKIGERVYNLERLINVTRGVDRSADIPPYRVLHEPISEGPSKGRYCPEETFQQLLDEYYQIRGWDSQGKPTSEKLAELRLA